MSSIFFKFIEIFFCLWYYWYKLIEFFGVNKMKNRLKELRQQRGLYQKDIASYLNIAVSTYSYWEKGTYEPDQAVLSKLADYFNVSVDYLLGREEKSSPAQQESGGIVIPEKYKDVAVAFYGGPDNLTQADIDDIVRFIEFTKSKKNQ